MTGVRWCDRCCSMGQATTVALTYGGGVEIVCDAHALDVSVRDFYRLDTRQPVTAPSTLGSYLDLIRRGVLIDMAGRPLRVRDCPICQTHRTVGETCPQSMQCPTCRRIEGGCDPDKVRPVGLLRATCYPPGLRPSGHETEWHHARWAASARRG